MKRLSRLTFAITIGACHLFPAQQAEAGDALLTAEEPVVDYSPESPWEYEFEFYGWLPNIVGDVGVKGLTSQVDIGPDDVLDNLNMVVSGDFAIRRGRVGVFGDFVYVEMSPSYETPGPLFKRTDLVLDETLIDLKGSYRLAEWDGGWVEAIAGARYLKIGLDLTLKPGLLPQRNANGSTDWWDAVGGIRARHHLSDRLFVNFLADAGGGSSDLTWQVEGGLGYFLTETIFTSVNYRYLSYEYTNGGFTFDAETHGFVIGLGAMF